MASTRSLGIARGSAHGEVPDVRSHVGCKKLTLGASPVLLYYFFKIKFHFRKVVKNFELKRVGGTPRRYYQFASLDVQYSARAGVPSESSRTLPP